MEAPKKRIIKKKTQTTTEPTVEVANQPVDAQPTETTDVEDNTVDDTVSFIPSSRVKNYISKEKLNKQVDSLITKLKENDASIDLNSILTEDLQAKLGSLIKQKEENNEEIKINTLAVELLSKTKFKFSHTSFKVLSVFLDLMIEDLTLSVMDEIIKSKKSIINLKYVFSADTNSKLYKIYSCLPTYVAEKALLNKSDSQEETSEEVTEDEQVDESTHSINFEFYVRKICNNLKKNKEEYSKIKVSNNYQKFCSNLILEFLDKVAPMTNIVLDVMTTKTITNLVFETIIRLQLYDNENSDAIMTELKRRLQ